MEESNELVEVDGNKITQQQLKEKKKEVEKKPGMKIVEVKPGVYRTKLED